MRERRRNLTRRQKIAAEKAGFNPAEWYLCSQNTRYWFLVSKADAEKRVSVPKKWRMRLMYKTALALPLKDFIKAHGIPPEDEIHVIRPTCGDDGEILKAETAYNGKAGDAGEATGNLTVNALNCDFWRGKGGYWYIELLPVAKAEAA